MIYLHYRFGVNPNARANNDTYTFEQFDICQLDGNIYIWDGGDVDTFVVKSYTDTSRDFFGDEYANVNHYGYFRTDKTYEYQEGQAFIGYGTQIERLIGSDFNDDLKGNVADDDIFGGKGDDRINGGGGADVLIGGAGQDTFVFDVLDGHIDKLPDFNPNEDRIELSKPLMVSARKISTKKSTTTKTAVS